MIFRKRFHLAKNLRFPFWLWVVQSQFDNACFPLKLAESSRFDSFCYSLPFPIATLVSLPFPSTRAIHPPDFSSFINILPHWLIFPKLFLDSYAVFPNLSLSFLGLISLWCYLLVCFQGSEAYPLPTVTLFCPRVFKFLFYKALSDSKSS